MKTLAVLSPSLSNKIEKSEQYILKIDSLNIPLAMIDVPEVEFDKDNPKNNQTVLVRKLGFSLNYRDLRIIQGAWVKLQKMNTDSYYPIGSDFCGEILEVGKDVKELKKGEIVVPDCFYPENKNGSSPGIPTNHASKELEIIPAGKLLNIPSTVSVDEASAVSIGIQTAKSMTKKVSLDIDSNILVTSPTSNTSLFLLNLLKNKKCNIYVLSYTGNSIARLKKNFLFYQKYLYLNHIIFLRIFFSMLFLTLLLTLTFLIC